MNNKPTIKIDFLDFGGMDKLNNHITRSLETQFKVVVCDKPDLVFFKENKSKIQHIYSCKKIFMTAESLDPDWNDMDYAITHNFTDDPRELRLPYYAWSIIRNPGVDLVKKNWDFDQVLKMKTKFCSMVVSNGNAKRTRERIEFFDKLTKIKKVDSGGAFRNNIGYQVPKGDHAKVEFNSCYRFHLCFENENKLGYTTEKIFDAMWAKCVPIYWGNEKIGEDFNSSSILHLNNYGSMDKLIEQVMEIENDPDLYLEYLKRPYFNNDKVSKYFSPDYLCDFIHKVMGDTKPPLSKRKKYWFGSWRFVRKIT